MFAASPTARTAGVAATCFAMWRLASSRTWVRRKHSRCDELASSCIAVGSCWDRREWQVRLLQAGRRPCGTFAAVTHAASPRRMAEALAQIYVDNLSDPMLVLSQPPDGNQWDFSANGGVTWKYLVSGGGHSERDLNIRLDAALDGCCDSFAWELQDHGMAPEAAVEVAVLRVVSTAWDVEPTRHDLCMPIGSRRVCAHVWPRQLAANLMAAVSDAAESAAGDGGSSLVAAAPAAVAAATGRVGALMKVAALPRSSHPVDAMVPLLLTRSQRGRWRAAAVDIAALEAGEPPGEPDWVLVSDDHNGHFDALSESARSARNLDGDDYEPDDDYFVNDYLPFADALDEVGYELAVALLRAFDAANDHGSGILSDALALQAAAAGDAAARMAYGHLDRLGEASGLLDLDSLGLWEHDIGCLLTAIAGWGVQPPNPTATADAKPLTQTHGFAGQDDPDGESLVSVAAYRIDASTVLGEAADAMEAASTAAELDAALTRAETVAFGYDDEGMVRLWHYYREVQPRLVGSLVCHHRPPFDVLKQTLHASTVKAAHDCLIEAAAASCYGLLTDMESGHSPNKEALDLAKSIAGEAARVGPSTFRLGGSIFNSAAQQLLRSLNGEDPRATRPAAVALLAVCQMLRTVVIPCVAPSQAPIRRTC